LRVLKQFGTALDAEFSHCGVLLRADGFDTAPQLSRDFRDRHARNKQAHHFEFALGQDHAALLPARTESHAVERRLHGRAEIFLPAHDMLDGPADVVHVVGLVDDRHHAHFAQTFEQGRILEHGEHDKLHPRELPADIAEQGHAVAVRTAGHGEIGDEDVAWLLLKQLDEFGRLARLADNVHLRKLVERLCRAKQNDGMIVGDDDFYSLAHLTSPVFRSISCRANLRRITHFYV